MAVIVYADYARAEILLVEKVDLDKHIALT